MGQLVAMVLTLVVFCICPPLGFLVPVGLLICAIIADFKKD